MTSACRSGCDGSFAPDNRLSADCDDAQTILWAERNLARVLRLPEPEVPEWVYASICADAGLGRLA